MTPLKHQNLRDFLNRITTRPAFESHPSEDELILFAIDGLEETQSDWIERHLLNCEHCAAQVETVWHSFESIGRLEEDRGYERWRSIHAAVADHLSAVTSIGVSAPSGEFFSGADVVPLAPGRIVHRKHTRPIAEFRRLAAASSESGLPETWFDTTDGQFSLLVELQLPDELKLTLKALGLSAADFAERVLVLESRGVPDFLIPPIQMDRYGVGHAIVADGEVTRRALLDLTIGEEVAGDSAVDDPCD